VQGTALTGSREALAWLQRTPGPESSAARDLRLDSRAVRAGDVFIAVAGETTDGRRYLGDAIAAARRPPSSTLRLERRQLHGAGGCGARAAR